MSETLATKAKRLPVVVLFADERRVMAKVRGDHGTYDVCWYTATGRYYCTCLAARGVCSHQRALAGIPDGGAP